jgi:DNA-binding NtrC family response regulator
MRQQNPQMSARSFGSRRSCGSSRTRSSAGRFWRGRTCSSRTTCRRTWQPASSSARSPALPQQTTLADAERVHILQTLERFGRNHSGAAEALGIGRTMLWRKLKEYGIDR